eukprot:gene3259-4081_t
MDFFLKIYSKGILESGQFPPIKFPFVNLSIGLKRNRLFLGDFQRASTNSNGNSYGIDFGFDDEDNYDSDYDEEDTWSPTQIETITEKLKNAKVEITCADVDTQVYHGCFSHLQILSSNSKELKDIVAMKKILSTNKTLEVLNIIVFTNERNHFDIRKVIDSHPSLRALSIKSATDSLSPYNIINPMNTTITDLQLTNVPLDTLSLITLMGNSPSIRRIDLNSVRGGYFIELFDALAKNQTITWFSLLKVSLYVPRQSLKNIFQNNSTLQHLQFLSRLEGQLPLVVPSHPKSSLISYFPQLPSDNGMYPCLPNNPNLQYLSLFFLSDIITQSIISTYQNLQFLEVEKLTQAFTIQDTLLPILIHINTLEKLSLIQVNRCEDDWDLIFRGLSSSNIKMLRIRQCDIALSSITKFIYSNHPTLVHLFLDCQIRSQSVLSNKTLKTLHIYKSDLSDRLSNHQFLIDLLKKGKDQQQQEPYLGLTNLNFQCETKDYSLLTEQEKLEFKNAISNSKITNLSLSPNQYDHKDLVHTLNLKPIIREPDSDYYFKVNL